MLGSIIETRGDQPVILHWLDDIRSWRRSCRHGRLLWHDPGQCEEDRRHQDLALDEPPEIAVRQQLRELTLQNKKGVA